jgi:two-component system, NarL family, sensor histidine kinase DesK
MHLKQNRYAAAVLLASALAGAIETLVPLSNGPGRADLNNPIGELARWIAPQWPSPAGAGWLAYQLFIAGTAAGALLFVALAAADARRGPLAQSPRLLAVRMALGIVLGSTLFNLVTAAQLALCRTWRGGAAGLALQVAVMFGYDVTLMLRLNIEGPLAHGIVAGLVAEQFAQVLAFILARLVWQETHTRAALAAAHAEVLATQALLGDTVRASERMRIARDLHDVIGHHLTALKLHLDLASRQAEGKAAASLQTSRELAGGLLAEVRAVVGTERDRQPIDLHAALRTLCAGIPAPAIRLAVDGQVHIASPALAHALFCCVREAVSNTVRHAAARELTISLQQQDGCLVLAIADDGNGRNGAPEGNGLRGMRERITQLGGAVEYDAPARGFGLRVSVPLAGALP